MSEERHQESESTRKLRIWEQHGQTIIMTLMTMAVAYLANAVVDSKAAQAATAVELKNLATHVARLEGAQSASQQLYVTRAEWSVHEQRIQALEAKR